MNHPLIYYTSCQCEVTLNYVKLSGEDAVHFMQGQSTQLLDGELRFHAFADRTGKVLSHFLAYIHENSIDVWIHDSSMSAFLEKLNKFIISEDVTWSQPISKKVFLLFNEVTAATLVKGCWSGVEVAISEERIHDLNLIKEEDFHYWCKWQGLPNLSDDNLNGEVINQTVLLAHAVSFKKGCFPGQEAVAKINNLKGAAWAPILLHKKTPNKFPEEILIEDKLVAKIQIDSVEGAWATALALRDIRVHNLVIDSNFTVKQFPRWPSGIQDRALELYHLGADFFQKGQEQEALEIWKLSLKLDPTLASSYEAIGVLLGRHEKFSEAEEWMKRLLDVDPDSIMAHTNLSLFLMRQDRIEEAEKHKALATLATFKSFGKQASHKKELEQKKNQELQELLRREEMFKQVLEIDPEDTLALSGMGSILMEKNQAQEALSYFLKVIQSDEKYSVAYLSLGKCYLNLNMKEKAKEIFEKGVKIAAKKGDLMPANEMQTYLLELN